MKTRNSHLLDPSESFAAPSAQSWKGALAVAILAAALAGVGPAVAQGASSAAVPGGTANAGTGSIQGRVFNTGNGEYVEKARISIEGAGLETFTDNVGQYYLSNVPAGPVKVNAFRTGLMTNTASITVTAGQTAQHNFNLIGFGKKAPPDDGTIQKLSEFVVAETKEMDGAAIAINEQRFASDIRNVITADEFGKTPEGNIGDLLKFVPGITINTGFGMSRGISVNGVPDNNVPVTVGGFNVASPLEGTSRQVDPQNLSTNNISRIEVIYSPTPETPGMALAGSINVVPRSAFERSKPIFNGSVFLLMRDDERSLSKSPGPGKDPTRKVHPGFNFSYLAPVNSRFGFTLSGGASRQYLNVEFARTTWQGVGAATNGTTFPDTTPDKPYLTSWNTQSSNSTDTSRRSLGATIDYKLGTYDRLSFSFTYVYYTGTYNNRFISFAVGAVRPGDFGASFTHGAPGSGNMSLTNDDYLRTNLSYTPTLTYRHDGPIWKADAGLGYSRGITAIYTKSKGYFFNSVARRTGLTVNFDDIFYLRPGKISVTDGATGTPVDPYDLNNYWLVSATHHTLDGDLNRGKDLQQSAYANLRRDFSWAVPVSLKGGMDVRQTVRDLRIGGQTTYAFVGADGRASTTLTGSDDRAAILLDESNSRRPGPLGLPPIQWVSNTKFLDLYKANPTYFTVNEVTAHSSNVNNSKFAEEVISSAYLRGDVQFFDRRLKLVGGLRGEQTNVKAEGPLTDLTRNYQRDASGKVILASNGRPAPITTDALATARLTIINRGLHAKKEYLRLFPSINGSFNIRENLIARAAYFYSVGRPNFNQYAGGITLPDTEAANQAGQRITVSNAGIKAWSAKSTKLMLEYYFKQVGLISVGVFRRDITNFFGGAVFKATPEFLSLYDLDPNVYGQYDVQTQENLTSGVRMEGGDVNYKQALTFLPRWARGVQIFANGSALRATGPQSPSFAGYATRTYNWGFSFARERYNLKTSWNYIARSRGSLVAAGRSIAP
ncbi:MAG: TonB-dependent receptor plug domain-containing protein, partial [Verrucomicrobia bacterium]|nr:TonB-dependent receptor plug domain-containing protein [Verrucomicrobiota bacterium]